MEVLEQNVKTTTAETTTTTASSIAAYQTASQQYHPPSSPMSIDNGEHEDENEDENKNEANDKGGELELQSPTMAESNNNTVDNKKYDADDGDDPSSSIARQTVSSLVQDFKEILATISAVSRSATTGTSTMSSTTMTGIYGSTNVKDGNDDDYSKAAFLLCNEVLDRFQNGDDDDDDEIVEVFQEEMYAEQNLVCKEIGLFVGDNNDITNPLLGVSNKSSNRGKRSSKNNKNDDEDDNGDSQQQQAAQAELVLAEKVALLQTVTRLIRAKTLVLTKRRMVPLPRDDSDNFLVI